MCGFAFAGVAHHAEAATININYTVDNAITALYHQAGLTVTSIPLGAGATAWTTTDTAVVALNDNTAYDIVFRAEDRGGIAMFIGDITGDVTVGSDTLSSVNWDVAPDAGGAAPADFNSLAWTAATFYGDWGVGPWNGNGMGAISTSADHIWSADNDADDFIWVRAQITTIPEPGSALLVGLGLSLACRRRR